MYKIDTHRPKEFDYDVIIIGSGAGGGVAAHLLARAGKRVAIVERAVAGGECPNFGCVPTKALLHAAELYQQALSAPKYGVYTHSASFNFRSVQGWKNTAVARTGTSEGKQVFASEGIDYLKGAAHFLSPWEISLGSARLRAKHFIIATGTRDIIPAIPGLQQTGYITYKQAIALERPPTSLFIIGGGAIGVEFAHLYRSFGSKVHIAEMAPHLLPREDEEAGNVLEAIFESKGIRVHTSAQVIEVTKQGQHKVVIYLKDGKRHKATVSEILVSIGKAPTTDIGLENAGVSYTKRGITVDDRLQTSAKHIYAAGDVTGLYMFTHTAAYQSRIAAHNILHRSKKSADYHAVPRCVYIDPEIASVGRNQLELEQAGIPFQTAYVPISVIGRSNVTDQDVGFVKLLASTTGVLLGASVVCPRAGEVIHELTLAIRLGLKANALTDTIHAFPTWSEAVRVAAAKIKCR